MPIKAIQRFLNDLLQDCIQAHVRTNHGTQMKENRSLIFNYFKNNWLLLRRRQNGVLNA